jgi:hypothetical protein
MLHETTVVNSGDYAVSLQLRDEVYELSFFVMLTETELELFNFN